jgi:hypothetical protein
MSITPDRIAEVRKQAKSTEKPDISAVIREYTCDFCSDDGMVWCEYCGFTLIRDETESKDA